MESNPDPAALAQQVQALAATIEELTKQNQEMKQRLQQVQQAQQDENRSKGNPKGEGDSHGRGTPSKANYTRWTELGPPPKDEERDGRTKECH